VGGPPAATVPAPPTIVNGVTDHPVEATIEDLGARVRVTAPGYLPREQATERTIFLWPAADPEYVRQLVYVAGDVQHPLERWEAGRAFRHCAGPGVDRAFVDQVADVVTTATGIPRTAAGACNVEWVIDRAAFGAEPGQEAFAARTYTADGRTVLSARLVFKDLSSLHFAGGHEIGHALGLGHSPRREDLMVARGGRGGTQFSQAELEQLAMVYRHRTAGNVWPDTEP
jgi:hypothetical protein